MSGIDLTTYGTAYDKIVQMLYDNRTPNPREERILVGLDALKRTTRDGNFNITPPCDEPILEDERLSTAYADILEACREFPVDVRAKAVNYINCLFTDLFVGKAPPDTFFEAANDISSLACTPNKLPDPFRPKPEKTTTPADDIGGCN